MCSVLRSEFRFKHLWLNFDHPEYFTSSQWRWPRPVYVIYRIIMAVYTIAAFIYSLVESPSPHTSMAYLTLWSYLVLTFHCFLAAVIAAFCHSRPEAAIQRSDIFSVGYDSSGSDVRTTNYNGSRCVENEGLSSPLPWYFKLSWVLANTVSVLAIVVTSIYFGALYQPSSGMTYNNVNIHILNSVFVIVDIFISARPVRLLHFIYPVVFGIIYVVFSVIYWAVDHTNVIYPNILDWNNVGITCGLIGGLICLAIFLHLIIFVLYRLRLLIFEKACT